MLIIFLGLLCEVFLNKKEYKIELIDGYTSKGSYSEVDTAKIYLRFQTKNKRARVVIYGIDQIAVDSFLCEADSVKPNVIDAWKNGAGYSKCYNYPCNKLKPGVYLIEKQIPLVIKNAQETAITVVIPFLNNQALNDFGGKSFYAFNSVNNKEADTLSLNRPSYLDKYSKTFLPWISKNYGSEAKYITESELEDLNSISNTKLLIFYGEVPFISEKMRTNIDNYIDHGGNMLVLTANFMNNRFYFSSSENKINLPVKPDHILWNYPDSKNPNYLTCGNSYELNLNKAKPSQVFSGYKIISSKFNLFETTLKDTLPLASGLYSSPPLLIYNNEIKLDTNTVKFYQQEILAYGIGEYGNKTSIGCAFYFQKNKNSGAIINVGNSEFFYSFENQKIGLILKNSISFLLNNKRISN